MHNKEEINNKRTNIFTIIIAVISIFVLLTDKLFVSINGIGFIIFSILCIGLGLFNRHSLGKIIFIVVYYLLFLTIYVTE
ncbi:hypothetical protein VBD025_01045 [Virgibacillus flavescens]|uniref:hypothetical protein n=1 Tax=Virgibacillus flavescens TaxID=1611422 RepID=UPI003D3383EA